MCDWVIGYFLVNWAWGWVGGLPLACVPQTTQQQNLPIHMSVSISVPYLDVIPRVEFPPRGELGLGQHARLQLVGQDGRHGHQHLLCVFWVVGLVL